MTNFLKQNKDLSLVMGMILILVVLFAPIPSFILDLAIIMNFGFALTILLMTFYVEKPINFSTFPSLLLITTLFRLSLNVAATRLILTGGDAGHVIDSIGSFAVSGNFIVGLVVFFILIIVQYVVVTSGAQRVSEVAARFTLDSMPGQQMSIDADLNMGLIDQKEALRRREELEKQASFYGAMDGASKFVKGDAIAGVIIILIDIIAGWIIGVVQMGMNWSEALQHFSLLTVGDGIATQLPALVIATATGIIVTRSAQDTQLTGEVFKQLSSIRKIPIIVGLLLFVLMLLPGMPKWPILILCSLCFIFWFQTRKAAQNALSDSIEDEEEAQDDEAITKARAPLEIALGSALFESWKEEQATILERLSTLRDTHEKKVGIAFPNVKLRQSSEIDQHEYEIRVFGERHAGAHIEPDRTLAIQSEKSQTKLDGISTRDPAFGLPAIWIEPDQEEAAKKDAHTLIDPVTVLITHLSEFLSVEAPSLLTRSTVVKLIDEVRDRQGGLIEELIPNQLGVSDIQRILQALMSENVSIANIDLIMEHLVDISKVEKDPSNQVEQLRQKMGYTICNALRGRHSELAVLSIDPKLENTILSQINTQSSVQGLSIDPKLAQSLLEKMADLSGKMQAQGRLPVILCNDLIRKPLQSLTKRAIPKLSVISVSEIPVNINLTSFELVKLE